MIKVLKGNRMALRWHLKVDGEDLDNLATAAKIIYAAKVNREDANVDSVIISEWYFGDAQVEIKLDDPTPGWVLISIGSTKMDVTPKVYFHSLQVEWGPEDKIEFIYGDGKLKVLQDVIR